MRRRYQVGIIVADAESHSTREYSGALTRAQLRALADAAAAGHTVLGASRARAAQRAVRLVDGLLANAELAQKQRLAGLPPRARRGGRA